MTALYIYILYIVYVEYFVMYICIYFEKELAGFDPQWMRYVGGRLKSGSSPILFIKLCMELKKF